MNPRRCLDRYYRRALRSVYALEVLADSLEVILEGLVAAVLTDSDD